MAGTILAARPEQPGPRRLERRRRREAPLREADLGLGERERARQDQLPDGGRVRRQAGGRRHVGRRGLRADRRARRVRGAEVHAGEASVVRVEIVGAHQLEAGVGPGRLVDLGVGATGPVQPARTVVGAREVDRGLIEDRGGALEVAGAILPPAEAPRRAGAVLALREPLEIIGEHGPRGRIVVGDDVVRGQVVQRLFRPRARLEVGCQRAGRRHVAGVIAERARRGEVEEARLGFPLGARQVRLQRGDGLPVPAEIVVALGDAQGDQLALVAAARRQRLERGLGVGVTARGEELLGTSQLARVIGGRRGAEGDHLRPRVGRDVAHRIAVVEVAVDLERPLAVAAGRQRPRQSEQHGVGLLRLVLRQRLVERRGGREVAGLLRRHRFADERPLAEHAGRTRRDDGVERLARADRFAAAQIDQRGVVARVLGDRRLRQRRSHEQRARLVEATRPRPARSRA